MTTAIVDRLSALEFEQELRRIARLDRPLALENPLGAAVEQIARNPAYTQSRLLTRILSALTYDGGDFRRAELSALDSATRGIVIALMDACRAGTTVRAQWVSAVDAANAAQSSAEG